MCIRSINDIRIEKCHNGCYKRYEWHKRYKISIYSSQTWKLTARDRGRGSSARHPGDVGPSMNHVEVARGSAGGGGAATAAAATTRRRVDVGLPGLWFRKRLRRRRRRRCRRRHWRWRGPERAPRRRGWPCLARRHPRSWMHRRRRRQHREREQADPQQLHRRSFPLPTQCRFPTRWLFLA